MKKDAEVEVVDFSGDPESQKVDSLISKLLPAWLLLVAVLLIQRPVFSPNLWWDLSRGREVASGVLNPSQSLLLLEKHYDADWCSGLPFYLSWMLGGIHLLAAVPLAAALSILSATCRHALKNRDLQAAFVFAPLFLWTARSGLQPTASLFDMFGLVLLWRLMNCSQPLLSLRKLLLLTFLTFLAWANSGPGPAWGLLWLLCVDCDRSAIRSLLVRGEQSSSMPVIAILTAALLGAILTPRGLFTWRDSFMLLSPTSFANTEQYGEASWRGLFSGDPWSATEYAFTIMWCVWVGREIIRETLAGSATAPNLKLRRFLTIFIPLLAALLSRQNLPVCGLWIFLDTLRLENSQRHTAALKSKPRQRFLIPACATMLLIPMAFDAAGQGLQPRQRLGWGIAQQIDPRLLDVLFQPELEQKVVGWAADGRSAGIALWQNPGLQLTDHPRRALLGGRIELHAALIDDLHGAHRARYRRDNGAWGGWVHQLAEWQVQIIFVQVEMERLYRDLQQTTWNALDIDSPTVPFVSTDDPRYSNALLDNIRKECFVEVGPWQPGMEIYDGMTWRFDAIELLGGGPDAGAAIRQSQRFRSMDIPMASLRALLPIRTLSSYPELMTEFQTCQNALAHQEWVTFGDASYFRKLVANTLALQQQAKQVPWPAVGEPGEQGELWDRCIELYVQGNVADAAQLLPCTTSEQNFATAMLWLECGETVRAFDVLQPLLMDSQSRTLRIAAEYWTEQIGLFQGM